MNTSRLLASISRRVRATARYLRLVGSQFFLTFLIIAVLLALGTLLFHGSPIDELGGRPPDWGQSLFATYALFALQPAYALPRGLALRAMYFLYPIFGLAVVADAVVRVSLLLFSRQENQKEWTKVLASTYRDHVILCGLGRVGFRVLQRMRQYQLDVVVIEKDERSAFLQAAQRMKVPVLLMDARQEESLEQAGLRHARALVIATNDDLANVEIALDARRLCPGIRVVLRMFDEGMADKLREAFKLDVAFSSAAAAAPMVAASLLELDILGSFVLDDREVFTARMQVHEGCSLLGRSLGQVAADHHVVLVSHQAAGARSLLAPDPGTLVRPGDQIVVQGELDRLRKLRRGLER